MTKPAYTLGSPGAFGSGELKKVGVGVCVEGCNAKSVALTFRS